MENLISASILNADLLHLEDVIHKLETAGADMLHFDVMDGVFVNNISFGMPLLKAMAGATHLFKDVHLMITDPLKYVDAFAQAGADLITFHYESVSDPFAVVEAIHAAGCKAGISIKPSTPAEAVIPFLDKVDLVLVMTVEPGFGGQRFMHGMMPKLSKLRRMVDEVNPGCILAVDGGVDANTHSLCKQNGANMLVAGSAYFKAKDRASFVKMVQG